MLVFGDNPLPEEPRGILDRVRYQIAPPAGDGVAAHGALVAAFIDASRLAQGLADVKFAELGFDSPSAVDEAANLLVFRLAMAVGQSWASGLGGPTLRAAREAARRLDRMDLPGEVRAKAGEGYAFYAVYPEAFFVAAARARLPSGTLALGLRSIGLGLAGMVAAATGGPPPLSARPTGPPFDRRLSLGPALRATLAKARSVAIIDEGPGLSGSSFLGAAEAIEGLRGDGRAIRFFPSHGGAPGPASSPSRRLRWISTERHWVGFDELLLRTERSEHRLESWAVEVIGPLVAPLVDLSGGRWRDLYAARRRPLAFPQQERRKYLAESTRGRFLLKFAGLGRIGMQKLDQARALHQAGFVPEPVGWSHGFLVERWVEGRMLDMNAYGRTRFIEALGAYLGFRARRFPAEAGSGASLAALAEMARVNIAEAGGEGDEMLAWKPDLDRLQREARPVEIDGRLRRCEWLVDGGGRLFKTDALDHHCGHDLVGCQDIAWDIAGASIEFGFSATEEARLAARVVRHAGRPVVPELIRFLKSCYAAFHGGSCIMAAGTTTGGDRDRLLAAADGYFSPLLRRALCPLANQTG